VALLAELPGLLRFTPESPSLTLLGRRRGSEDHGSPIMRIDLPKEFLLDAAVAAEYYEVAPGYLGGGHFADDGAGSETGASPRGSVLDIPLAVRARADELGVRVEDVAALDGLMRPIVQFLASSLLPIVREHDLDQVVAVVMFADGCAPGTLGWAAVESFARVLRVGFESVGAHLHSCLVAESIGEGAAWREAGSGGASGVQSDPRQGRIAAESVVAGSQIFDRRADIEELYAEEEGAGRLPPRPSGESGEGADSARRTAANRGAGVEREPTEEDFARGERRLAQLARGGVPTESGLAEVAEVLTSPEMSMYLLEALVSRMPGWLEGECTVTPDEGIAVEDTEESGTDENIPEDDGTEHLRPCGEHGADQPGNAPFGAEPGDLAMLVPLARRGMPACRSTALLLIGIAYYLRGVGVHALVCAEAAEATGHLRGVCRCVLSMLEQGIPPAVAADILEECLSDLRLDMHSYSPEEPKPHRSVERARGREGSGAARPKDDPDGGRGEERLTA